jgi:hypothetical protein
MSKLVSAFVRGDGRDFPASTLSRGGIQTMKRLLMLALHSDSRPWASMAAPGLIANASGGVRNSPFCHGVLIVRVISALVIACSIAIPAHGQQQQQIAAPTLYSIRGGETLMLRLFGVMTADCVSTFTAFDGIDILDGPPEIALNFEPGQVNLITAAGRVCNPVSGGTIMISAAKDISEQKEANLTFRVRYKTKQFNAGALTYRYHVLLFPAASGGAGEQGVTAKRGASLVMPEVVETRGAVVRVQQRSAALVAAKTKRKVARAQQRPAAAISSSGRTCGFGFWEAGQTCVSQSGRVCTIAGSTHSKLRCD